MKVQFITTYKQIQLWGDVDREEPAWSGSIASSLGGILIGTASDNVRFDVEFHNYEAPAGEVHPFFTSKIDVPAEGMELFLISEADEELPSGNLGSFYKLPWLGITNVQLVSPRGFESDDAGERFPRSLDIYLSPVRD